MRLLWVAQGFIVIVAFLILAARYLQPSAQLSPAPYACGPELVAVPRLQKRHIGSDRKASFVWLELQWAESISTPARSAVRPIHHFERGAASTVVQSHSPEWWFGDQQGAITLVVADAFALSPNSVILLGLFLVASTSPEIRCTLPGGTAAVAAKRVFVTRSHTSPREPNAVPGWRGSLFSFFAALCEWDKAINTPAISIEGTHPVKYVSISPAPEPLAAAGSPNITVCLSGLYGNFKYSHLVQFIEYYRWLGATHFLVYDFDRNPSTIRIADTYPGVVTLVNWDSPTKRYPSWYRGQALALNDCLRRARMHSAYVLNVDMDEYLFPAGLAANNSQDSPLQHAIVTWEREKMAQGKSEKRLFVLFASVHYLLACPQAGSSRGLLVGQMVWRSRTADCFSAGPRSGWAFLNPFFLSNSPPADGFAGRAKYLMSTAVNWVHMDVHSVRGDHTELFAIFPEVDNWRINHYQGLTYGCTAVDENAEMQAMEIRPFQAGAARSLAQKLNRREFTLNGRAFERVVVSSRAVRDDSMAKVAAIVAPRLQSALKTGQEN
eukprot:TRINITY_DN18856_c0_g1_i1.p1 TRINITY_DN18856_c0_g1~~TRINITY_DN18856_c0_g1_i1.p1  ORF type:complete len:558 (+),score=72.19 TRINITY_DN18856_c0_g1_i1:23-1675(+)